MIHTSFALLLAYVTLFCVGVVSFCLLVSVFFSNAKLAAVLDVRREGLFFGAVLPKYVFFAPCCPSTSSGATGTSGRPTSCGRRSCCRPPSRSARTSSQTMNTPRSGVTLDNMHEGDYSFASCLLMLCVDTRAGTPSSTSTSSACSLRATAAASTLSSS